MKVTTIQKILSAILFLISCNVALSQEQIGVAAAVNKNTVDLTPEERLLVEAGYKIIQNRTIETDEIGKAQMLLYCLKLLYFLDYLNFLILLFLLLA